MRNDLACLLLVPLPLIPLPRFHIPLLPQLLVRIPPIILATGVITIKRRPILLVGVAKETIQS